MSIVTIWSVFPNPVTYAFDFIQDVSFCRDNNVNTTPNAMYVGNIISVEDETQPEYEGHIYVNMDQKQEMENASTVYENLPINPNTNDDSATIKPNQVTLDSSYMPNAKFPRKSQTLTE